MASHKRTDRINRLLQQHISSIIQRDVKNPRIGFVTVTKVSISRDLRHAKIFVSILGEKDKRDQSLDALTKATPFIRREIAARIKLRYTPEIRFYYDETIEKAVRIFSLLEEVKKTEDKGK
ncbi:MAG: 30S ribosome-binding factor RbfA [bacterium]